MTTLRPLPPIIWIPLLLAYFAVMIYALFWLDVAKTPVQSLPLTFWMLVLSLPLFSLVAPRLFRRFGGMRPTTESDYTPVLLSGAGLLICAILSAILSSLKVQYVTGGQVLLVASACGIIITGLVRGRLAQSHTKAIS